MRPTTSITTTFPCEGLDDHMAGMSAYFSPPFLAFRTNAFYQTSTNRLHAHTPKSTRLLWLSSPITSARFLSRLVPPTEDSIGNLDRIIFIKSRGIAWHWYSLWHRTSKTRSIPRFPSFFLFFFPFFLSFFPTNLSLCSLPLIFPTHTLFHCPSLSPLPEERKELGWCCCGVSGMASKGF